jgi:hypothetical protein
MSGGRDWRRPLSLVLAAAVGAAAAIAVDRFVLDDGDAATADAGDVALTPDDLGGVWSLDTTVDLGGPDDVGLLSGCALTGGLAGDDPGSFTSLSDGSGDAITNEIRVTPSAAHAAEVFDAASSIEAVECVRSSVESQAVSQLAPGIPAAVIEPLQTTPWAEQAMAYRVQVNVAGLPVQHTDVHIVRSGPAIAVVQIFDQGEAMSDDVAVEAVNAVLDGMVSTFG